jgi:diguanylate cyclase (GGDEF)-like protein
MPKPLAAHNKPMLVERLRAAWSKTLTWYSDRTRTFIDLVAIAALIAPLFALLIYVEAFDNVFEWSRAHEDWEIDELFALGFCLGLIAIIFAWRRLVDLRGEMAERKEAEQEAHRLARHDVLTGLPNRRRFLESFQKLTGDLAEGQVCAMFVADLDHFKPINDLYGHRLGDEVLRIVAQRLMEIVGDDGMVARLGGDEFGVLVPYARDDEVPIRFARRMVYEIPQPIKLAALSLEVGISIGVAVYDPEMTNRDDQISLRDGSQLETTLRQADMAMYRAKTEGRGLYRFFDRAMDETLQERVQLEREIKGAIAKGEIVPFYQPLVDLHTQEVTGYEILARWQHPTRGLLLPEVFIPIAEDTGAIGDLTYSVLLQAVQDAKGWPSHTHLSLNLSPRQFADPWLAQKLLSILSEGGFPPQRLEIEITETAVVQRLDEAKIALQSLRNLGVQIALDDFGTGYSGLYHLRELSLDTLKIDRSFVMQMLDRPEEARIVQAIIALGQSLGLQTTAEGIESKEVLAKLIDLGCNTGQGFLFGKPEPSAVASQDEATAKRRA